MLSSRLLGTILRGCGLLAAALSWLKLTSQEHQPRVTPPGCSSSQSRVLPSSVSELLFYSPCDPHLPSSPWQRSAFFLSHHVGVGDGKEAWEGSRKGLDSVFPASPSPSSLLCPPQARPPSRPQLPELSPTLRPACPCYVRTRVQCVVI